MVHCKTGGAWLPLLAASYALVAAPSHAAGERPASPRLLNLNGGLSVGWARPLAAVSSGNWWSHSLGAAADLTYRVLPWLAVGPEGAVWTEPFLASIWAGGRMDLRLFQSWGFEAFACVLGGVSSPLGDAGPADVNLFVSNHTRATTAPMAGAGLTLRYGGPEAHGGFLRLEAWRHSTTFTVTSSTAPGVTPVIEDYVSQTRYNRWMLTVTAGASLAFWRQ